MKQLMTEKAENSVAKGKKCQCFKLSKCFSVVLHSKDRHI